MPAHPFVTYDVFTDTRFAGNPLAVVFDADNLSDAQMQRMAREFNLSETVFVQSPENKMHSARARIFTPSLELPFAGHPTIGAAIALAERERTQSSLADLMIVLEEKIGPVRCAVKLPDVGATFAEFDAPKISGPDGADPEIESAAARLGLTRADVGFDAHLPSRFSAGVGFSFVPVASLEALAKATPAPDLGQTFVYARALQDAPESFRARMFAPGFGIWEDPATGGAAAAFAGVLARFEDLPEGWSTLPILQGVEMGRPSLIGLEVNVEGRTLLGARIAGKAVKVSEGVVFV